MKRCLIFVVELWIWEEAHVEGKPKFSPNRCHAACNVGAIDGGAVPSILRGFCVLDEDFMRAPVVPVDCLRFI